jgi:hypothetical protein
MFNFVFILFEQASGGSIEGLRASHHDRDLRRPRLAELILLRNWPKILIFTFPPFPTNSSYFKMGCFSFLAVASSKQERSPTPRRFPWQRQASLRCRLIRSSYLRSYILRSVGDVQKKILIRRPYIMFRPLSSPRQVSAAI